MIGRVAVSEEYPDIKLILMILGPVISLDAYHARVNLSLGLLNIGISPKLELVKI